MDDDNSTNTDKALAALNPFRSHGARLEEIARYLLDREY